MERHQRLKLARELAGFESGASAVRALGVPYATYASHEGGWRGIKDGELKQYARRFKVPFPWLAHEIGELKGQSAPSTVIVGKIGAGNDIMPIDDHAPGAGLDEIDLPPGAPPNAVAVKIEGNSQYPRYFNGELVFYTRDHIPPAELVGRECVVQLADGRMMLKILRRGSRKNLFNLESWNAPTLEDAQVEWAAPVKWRASI